MPRGDEDTHLYILACCGMCLQLIPSNHWGGTTFKGLTGQVKLNLPKFDRHGGLRRAGEWIVVCLVLLGPCALAETFLWAQGVHVP